MSVNSLLELLNGVTLLGKVELQLFDDFRLLLLVLAEVLHIVEEPQLALCAQDLLSFLDILVEALLSVGKVAMVESQNNALDHFCVKKLVDHTN